MRWIVTISTMFAVACGAGIELDSNSDSPPNNTNNSAEVDAGTDVSSSSAMADAAAADMADVGGEGVDASPLDVMDRPADVYLPDDYDPATSYPLLVLLHGYSANALVQDYYFGTSMRVSDRDFVLVTPDGTSNEEGKKFWNGYWCCDFYGQGVDDVAYVSGLIAAAKERFNIDDRRVYLLGHSNGGFMSYRMACDVEGITAIASLAGSGPEEEVECASGGGVSVLQIHGTEDDTILYDGEVGKYPAATEMTRRWAARNGCDAEPTSGDPLDLVGGIQGAETTTERWNGCDGGTTVELWTIQEGSHIPTPNENFRDGILDFLLSHEVQ